jgi:isoleucyl-tRNA synthetase
MDDPQSVDLKQTVNLPKTAFSMKANLPQTEPKTLARWEKERLYHQIRSVAAGRPRYILHDGPPYANGRIHLGTAFNKILKDFIVKSKTMAGFDAPYVPGWDCHGLPIEIKVDSELGAKKAQMSPVEIRRVCRKYAEKYVDLQRTDFKRLGVLGQWEDPYLTMSAHYQAVIAGAFTDFLEKGYVYKGLKPVHWCIKDRTALAEAEVEYENDTSPSIWVRFRLMSDPAAIDPALAGRAAIEISEDVTVKQLAEKLGVKPAGVVMKLLNHGIFAAPDQWLDAKLASEVARDFSASAPAVYGLIWTTTPWTMPANVAIAFNPKFEYVAAEVGGAVYIVAGDLLQVTAEKCGWTEPRVLARFPGAKLDRAVFRHPFLERDSLGLLADHVTLEQGTGAVHTAPGHGQEDYVSARQYGLEIYCPVDAAGRFFHATGAAGRLPEALIGKTVWEANPLVIEILKARGALLKIEKLAHSYPHCWRCHKPVIFRATEQWFIGMDRNDFRERALEAVRRSRWIPEWGQERISNMIASRPDWCISRQRAWGVPIIVFYCEGCREPLTDRKILDGIVQLFREHTADIWYERTAAELLPAGTKCAKCGGTEFSKENDILDVWFDSGSSHLAVLNGRFGLEWPADMYIEGGDQYRGWFQSSLLVGTGLKGGAPYRASALSGWVLDGEGRAMHKSLGNTIEPEEVIKHHGAEILRLWSASVEFSEDVRLSETILTRLVDAYRKLRNTFRYLLGNLHDFDPQKDQTAADQFQEIDQWILVRAADTVELCRDWYEKYEFHHVFHHVYAFATVDLSSVYLDVLKDRLYCSAPGWPARRSAQTALYRLLDALVRLLAPIMSFTTEEVWTHMGRPGSVHTALFPERDELTAGLGETAQGCHDDWEKLMGPRAEVMRQLEAARNEKRIGAPLEARVVLTASHGQADLLERYAAELPALFIVSQVEVKRAAEGELSVTVERAAGEKCERCWRYTTDTGADSRYPTVCGRCAQAVGEMLHG